jgi:PAS domain S-box-containing protein
MGSADLVSPEDKMKMEEIIQNTHPDSLGQNEITFWINRKDGTRRCILGRVTAAAKGKTISTYVTMTDVTESAERERALRDRITALQQLIS